MGQVEEHSKQKKQQVQRPCHRRACAKCEEARGTAFEVRD